MITSTLNGVTKWTGPGSSAYDAASAVMGEEVSAAPRSVRSDRSARRVRFAGGRHTPHGPQDLHNVTSPLPLLRSSMLTWPTQASRAARSNWAASGRPAASSGRSVAVRPGGRRTPHISAHSHGGRSMGRPFRVPRRRAPLTVARRSALPPWWTRLRVPSRMTKKSTK